MATIPLMQITRDDTECLRDAFALFDADDDGEITTEELAKIMNHHGFYPSPEELNTMVGNVDKNSNGTVDYDEFVEMMLKRKDVDKIDDIAQAFKVFDKDGDGLISAEEIRITMNDLGEELTEEEVKAMLAEADVNGDGQIDFTEFKRIMINSFGFEEHDPDIRSQV